MSQGRTVRKKDANAQWWKIQAVKWADFAGSGCLKFRFAVKNRFTCQSTVLSLLDGSVIMRTITTIAELLMTK